MSKFLKEPKLKFCDSDAIFQSDGDMLYHSDYLDADLEIKSGFFCDLASIPLHIKWAHREGLLHDGMFRKDFSYILDGVPTEITFCQANRVFVEAMAAKGKSWWLRYSFYSIVSTIGYFSWHKKMMDWHPGDDSPVCGNVIKIEA